MKSSVRVFALLLIVSVLAACASMPKIEPPAATETDHHAEAPHWSYEGEAAPEHWGDLSSEWAVCSTGQEQSPINLDNAAAEDLVNVEFNYKPSMVRILNNGHTIQVNYAPGSYIVADGERYDLVQFHFHAPSEHTVGGQSFPAELHLVHKSAQDELAVVGVLLAEGAENAAYQPVWKNLPATETPVRVTSSIVSAGSLLPADKLTYRYSGSLTTPPCSEGVHWFVMTTPVELSAEQIAAFVNIYDGNNRPVQPVNARELAIDTTP